MEMTRTWSLMHRRREGQANSVNSVSALETIGVWERCQHLSAPLKVMRIIDDTRRLIRAPEVDFVASEIGHDAFGYNIENRHLVMALEARAAELDDLTRIDSPAQSLRVADDEVVISPEHGEPLRAELIIGADGKQSKTRQAAGIEINTRAYPQTALSLILTHTRPHRNISTEFHTETGPFTLVPLPGDRSSLVCVVTPEIADTLAAMDDQELALEIERRSHSILGKVTIEPGRGFFPLMIQTVESLSAPRVALIGEAAHVLPPIGAQGLNLGLRDAAAIAQLVAEASRRDDDIGGPHLLNAYDRMRRSDIGARSIAVNALNRSLLSDFLGAQGIRGIGLFALDRIGPLRRALMRQGIAGSGDDPRLMRGERI